MEGRRPESDLISYTFWITGCGTEKKEAVKLIQL